MVPSSTASGSIAMLSERFEGRNPAISRVAGEAASRTSTGYSSGLNSVSVSVRAVPSTVSLNKTTSCPCTIACCALSKDRERDSLRSEQCSESPSCRGPA